VHASKKRFAVPAYSIGAVQQHNGNIDELMTLFISKLDNFATTDEKTTCDLGNWIHYLAFDVGSRLISIGLPVHAHRP
jgi:hypothetical protein